MYQLMLTWVEAGQRRSQAITDQYPSRYPGKLRMGRDPSQCDLVINDPTVSGLHVELQFEPEKRRVYLRNLREQNPPRHNGLIVRGGSILREGSQIGLGDVEIKISGLKIKPSVATTGWSVIRGSRHFEDTSVSLSQLIPIVSTGSDLTQKGFLLPGLFTVVVVVSLFSVLGHPIWFNLLLAFYIGISALYFIYSLCGKSKPWWVLLACGLGMFFLVLPPIFAPFHVIFREILPGGVEDRVDLISTFASFFFGAGLLEELLKVIPVFIAMAIGRILRSPWREKVGVWEPLDGILLASATALSFTWLETLSQYVPGVILEFSQQAGPEAGELLGLQVLIPRILGSVAGHMAYSGYLGYFIGLSALKPRQSILILSTGYLTASLLHALWNTAASINALMLALVGMVSYAFLSAAILKARQLSPERAENFATDFLPRP
ncbi:MAG: PrsW family glutamic-type intramembrane protease [Cyanobacteriota bacterium]|nr:PrsW family glutamic-type intramembrane protease [Cyanobacteriota bacterium]